MTLVVVILIDRESLISLRHWLLIFIVPILSKLKSRKLKWKWVKRTKIIENFTAKTVRLNLFLSLMILVLAFTLLSLLFAVVTVYFWIWIYVVI